MANHPAQDPHAAYWSDGDPVVPVFQRPAEFDQLLAMYRQRRPRRILEIGTYYGGTLKQWLQHATRGAVVVSVDTYAIPQADNRRLYASWAKKGVAIHALEGRSDDPAIVAQVRDLGPYDWVLIDADHTLGAVSRDWQTYGPMCAPGGVIIFHDILDHPAHPEIQVIHLWREIKASGAKTFEIVEDRAALWGGLGVVER